MFFLFSLVQTFNYDATENWSTSSFIMLGRYLDFSPYRTNEEREKEKNRHKNSCVLRCNKTKNRIETMNHTEKKALLFKQATKNGTRTYTHGARECRPDKKTRVNCLDVLQSVRNFLIYVSKLVTSLFHRNLGSD